MCIRDSLSERDIVFKHVRPGTNDAHLTAEHVEELRQFIDAKPAHPTSESEHSGIGRCGLQMLVVIVEVHRPELENVEGLEPNACAPLLEEQWTGRLPEMDQADE